MDKKPLVYNPFTAEDTIERQRLRIITLENENRTLKILLKKLKDEMESVKGDDNE